MSELWFEDRLFLTSQALEGISKEIAKSATSNLRSISDELTREARGVIRAQKPDWGTLTSEEMKNVLSSGRKAKLIKVRLIFEFEIPKENFDRGARFVYARCAAYLRSTGGSLQPEVYDLFPRDLYEGEPQKVGLKFGPEIKMDKIGVSAGEISTDVAVGQISPVIVGYFGTDKREPHWELRPKNKSLLGKQYLWLVLVSPHGCEGIRLASRVEADIQTKFGPVSVGPKETLWENRPSIIIR
jgi:hypothetical protein